MKKYRRLTLDQRVIIQEMIRKGKKKIDIAIEVGCDRSSITREIKRNSNMKGGYNALGAQAYCNSRKRHIIEYKRKIDGALEEFVKEQLESALSPQQISERLKVEESKWSVSHETIYKWIYTVAPGYKKYLRWKSRCRQKRSVRPRRGLHSLPRKFIDERCQGANQRLERGHWERDLLEGRRGGPALLVLVERLTRKTIARKVKTKHCNEVNRVTAEALQDEYVKSITNDNGVEFGNWQELKHKLGCEIYYCHPYASSERGTVENTNGLIRQFFPKGVDFRGVTEDLIEQVEININNRPRKLHGYRSANEIHNAKKTKLVYSEAYYRKQQHERFKREFREDMLRETGMFLEGVI